MSTNAARVTREEREGLPVWRKSFGPTERAAARSAMRMFAGWRGLPALGQPLAQTARQACDTEAAFIGRLAALGARVPTIHERGETHLLLEDIGATLSSDLRGGRDEARDALRRGFDALGALHAAGGYTSQAFPRNLTWDGQRVGFIDLEDDPGTIMPVVAAQARDLILFVQSSARFFEHDEQAFRELLSAALARESDPVRAEVIRTARALNMLIGLALRLGGSARRAVLGLRWLALA